MLRKLMKYEFKATSRYFIPLYILLACITGIDLIALSIKPEIYHKALALIPVFLITTYIFTIIAIGITSVLISIYRFYKNLLTDEGYLMFTLPVSTHQLILSKLFISLFWYVVSFLAVMLSIFLLGIRYLGWGELTYTIRSMFMDFYEIAGSQFAYYIFIFTVLTIVGIFYNILSYYVSIAVGQRILKNKIVGAIITYIGIYAAMQILSSLLMIWLVSSMASTPESMSKVTFSLFPISTILFAMLSVLFYFITNYMFKKQLNLE